MATFIALYRGETVGEAKLIAVSADPKIVAQVTLSLLRLKPDEPQDIVLAKLERGRRAALKVIRHEAVKDMETE